MMIRVFAVLLLFTGIVLQAASPTSADVDRAIAAYRQDPLRGRGPLQQMHRQLQAAFSDYLRQNDAEYRRLCDELEELCRNPQTDPSAEAAETKELAERLAKATAELAKLRGDESRLGEVAAKRQEVKALQQRLLERRNDDSANPRLAGARRKCYDYLAEAAKRWPAPDALNLRKISAVLDGASGKSRRTAPFAGLYDGIDNPGAIEWKSREETVRFLERRLRVEHPKADPEKIRVFAALQAGTLNRYPETIPLPDKPCEEPFEEIFRAACLFSRNQIDRRGFLRLVTPVRQKLAPNSILRAQLSGILHSFAPPDDRPRQWEQVQREWLRVLKSVKLAEEDYGCLYDLIVWLNLDDPWDGLDRYFEGRELDPWMRAMIAGLAAIERGWQGRGGGYADTVSQEGWRIFEAEMAKAAQAFNTAIQLHPERPQPYEKLLYVGLGKNGPREQSELMRKILPLKPFSDEAYHNLTWSLLPRWCGPHEILLQLGDEVIGTRRGEEMRFVGTGMGVIGLVAWDYPDYRWKNIYRRPGFAEKIDAHFAAYDGKFGGFNDWWKNSIRMNRMLFEMATLRYDQALETRRQIGLDDEAFLQFWLANRWFGLHHITNWVARVPSYMNPVTELALFTGPQAAPLREIELEFLDRDPAAACRRLAQLIREGKFSVKDRQFLIDLYGRWRLPKGGSSYSGTGNSFREAGTLGRPDIVREILELGFDYSAEESYPGETACVAVTGSADGEILEILKKLGDPLDRPEPEYGRRPIHLAAYAGNAAKTKKLLELGCVQTVTDRVGKHMPIHFAAVTKSGETVRILIENGANVDAQDKDGDTPLMLALEAGSPRAVWEPLARASKNLNLRKNGGRTALHFAVGRNVPEAFQLLLALGADPNVKDDEGKTPADRVREGKNPAFLKLLPSARP